MITYISNSNITKEQIKGFCVGWLKPLSEEQLLNLLNESKYVFLAMDNNKVVGFIQALSDGYQVAFIHLLEVLPEYQGKGIGTKLVELMIEATKDINCIDLVCDDTLLPFYERFGMMKANACVLRNYN